MKNKVCFIFILHVHICLYVCVFFTFLPHIHRVKLCFYLGLYINSFVYLLLLYFRVWFMFVSLQNVRITLLLYYRSIAVD